MFPLEQLGWEVLTGCLFGLASESAMPTVFRDDLSDRLVHLTKGENNRPFETLVSILNDRALRGGTGFIKGKHTCVCFSEAPLSKLPQILSTPHDDVKYKPYGVMFKKSWISQGAAGQ